MALALTAFDSARWKIQRARKHIQELDAAIGAYLASDFCRFTTERDGDGGSKLAFEITKRLDCEIPMAMGDAAHNLRSALDHVWMTLARACGVTARLSFPFHETRKNLEDLVSKSPVKAAFPEVETLILDRVKPYAEQGGQKMLWAVTKLDNIDKHNLLLATVSQTGFRDVQITSGGLTISIGSAHLKGQGPLNIVGTNAGNLKVQYEQKPTFAILFGDAPLEGEEVLPCLVLMARLAEEAVEAFSHTFAS